MNQEHCYVMRSSSAAQSDIVELRQKNKALQDRIDAALLILRAHLAEGAEDDHICWCCNNVRKILCEDASP